ncbi:hypothetical protein D3C73_1570320 [compost metagenome]
MIEGDLVFSQFMKVQNDEFIDVSFIESFYVTDKICKRTGRTVTAMMETEPGEALCFIVRRQAYIERTGAAIQL